MTAGSESMMNEPSLVEPWHKVVLLPPEVLENPPSKSDGIDWDTESVHRAWGCEIIQEAGILLRLPQVVMCTGQTILQRFYYRKSLLKFDPFSVSMSCVLLATKIEEAIGQTRVRDIILVFHRIYLRRRGLPIECLELGGPIFKVLREEMNRVERHILKELGFGFYNIMDHPHRFILYYVRVLGWNLEATQRSWSYLNDSLRTDLCLRYRAEILACAAIYMSARKLCLRLPQNPPWWKLFNAELKDVGIICNTILALYKQPKMTWIDPLNMNSIFAAGKGIRLKDIGATAESVSPTPDSLSSARTEKFERDGSPIGYIKPPSSTLSSPALPPRKIETPMSVGPDVTPFLEVKLKPSPKAESPSFQKQDVSSPTKEKIATSRSGGENSSKINSTSSVRSGSYTLKSDRQSEINIDDSSKVQEDIPFGIEVSQDERRYRRRSRSTDRSSWRSKRRRSSSSTIKRRMRGNNSSKSSPNGNRKSPTRKTPSQYSNSNSITQKQVKSNDREVNHVESDISKNSTERSGTNWSKSSSRSPESDEFKAEQRLNSDKSSGE